MSCYFVKFVFMLQIRVLNSLSNNTVTNGVNGNGTNDSNSNSGGKVMMEQIKVCVWLSREGESQGSEHYPRLYFFFSLFLGWSC